MEARFSCLSEKRKVQGNVTADSGGFALEPLESGDKNQRNEKGKTPRRLILMGLHLPLPKCK